MVRLAPAQRNLPGPLRDPLQRANHGGGFGVVPTPAAGAPARLPLLALLVAFAPAFGAVLALGPAAAERLLGVRLGLVELGGARKQLLLRLRLLRRAQQTRPEGGVVLPGGGQVGHLERVEQAVIGGGVRGLVLFGAREDVVQLLLCHGQRAALLLLRLLLVLEQILSPKAQNRRQLVLVEQVLGLLVHLHLPGGVHSLDDQVIKHHLPLGTLEDVLLHRVLGHKPVDVHRVLLADAVRAGHGLQVVLRVPVAVKDDHRVRRREVDAQPARTRRQQKQKVLRPGSVEVVHRLVPRRRAYGPVQALMLVPLHAAVV
mmetsp:Transcript_31084/g.59984  ORF Transcript_31084/g.59984 Transcript_31084/m.59984 type:complete len:315 (-) Transcript_31084:1667-2611(-)